MDCLPNEVISEVLVHACENAGETIEAKFAFPGIPSLISKRFRLVTLSTHRLWVYAIFYGLPSDKLYTRMARSGTLPLRVKVVIRHGQDEAYRQFLQPILPRLFSLCFAMWDCGSTPSLAKIFTCKMPRLEELDMGDTKGTGNNPVPQLLPGLLPKLRSFRSFHGYWKWEKTERLPDTVEMVSLEEAVLDDVKDLITSLRSFLPQKLRHLRMSLGRPASPFGYYMPGDSTLRFPELNELRLEKIMDSGALAFLDRLDAPALERIVLEFKEDFWDDSAFPVDEEYDPEFSPDEREMARWSFDLPVLKYLQITAKHRHPCLISLAQDYPSITHLVVQVDGIHRASAILVERLETRHGREMLLPQLEMLQVFGVTVSLLQRMACDRPLLKLLKLHATDLGLTDDFGELAFTKLNRTIGRLESSVELSITNVSSWAPCEIAKKRFRTWEDVNRDNFIRFEVVE